jgi:hypothetical protein
LGAAEIWREALETHTEEEVCMDLGIFIPIGNNGWMMSANSPQYLPSFQLNRAIAAKAEAYGFASFPW